jgi:hypothetical protein
MTVFSRSSQAQCASRLARPAQRLVRGPVLGDWVSHWDECYLPKSTLRNDWPTMANAMTNVRFEGESGSDAGLVDAILCVGSFENGPFPSPLVRSVAGPATSIPRWQRRLAGRCQYGPVASRELIRFRAKTFPHSKACNMLSPVCCQELASTDGATAKNMDLSMNGKRASQL